jgi:hypothetical protein
MPGQRAFGGLMADAPNAPDLGHLDFRSRRILGNLAGMPAPEAQVARRGKLVQGLFWGGVGLAPLAILILLFGSGTGSLRVAVTLSVLTMVMLGVSIAMRPSIEMLRVDIEHRVLDEMERVRIRTRDDIANAARNTHRALTDRMTILTAHVEDLRGAVDEVQAQAMLPPTSPVSAHQVSGPPGMVRRTETVHVTRRTTTAMAGDGDPSSTGTVYGSKSAVDGEWRERPDGGSRHRDERDERESDDRHDDRHRSRDDRDDRHRGRDDRDDRRDDRYRDERDDDRYRARDDRDDDRYRARDERREDRRDERRDDRRDDRRVDRRDDRDDRYRDDHWDSGDRWAAVREDDRGRELRIGERRSSVRSDDHGTEYRVEDRWAAMRHDDPPGYRGDSEWESTFRSLRSDSPRALPPAIGDSPSRYTEDYDRERDYGPVRSRGRERLARSGRDYDDDRDDRYPPRPRTSSEYDR